jgi:hypothetical protein
VNPFCGQLPIPAELMRPSDRPGVPRIVAGRPVLAAQLMRAKLIETRGQALPAKLDGRETERCVVGHAELIIAHRIRADGGVAVDILRDESPMRTGLEACTKTRETGVPCTAAGDGHGAGIGQIVVAQRPNLEAVIMAPGEAGIVAGPAIYLMIEVDGRFSEAARQRRGPIGSSSAPMVRNSSPSQVLSAEGVME